VARISSQFGIVVRKARLQELQLDLDTVLQKLDADVAFDEDEQVLSLGPHFDDAAATDLAARLTAIGLLESEDFFVFRSDVPEWCALSVTLVGEELTQA
jgi:hypothetical protein